MLAGDSHRRPVADGRVPPQCRMLFAGRARDLRRGSSRGAADAGMTSEAIDLLGDGRPHLRPSRAAPGSRRRREFAQARARCSRTPVSCRGRPSCGTAVPCAGRGAPRPRFSVPSSSLRCRLGPTRSVGPLHDRIEQTAQALSMRHFWRVIATAASESLGLRLQSGDAAGARTALEAAPLSRGSDDRCATTSPGSRCRTRGARGRRSRALVLARTGLDESLPNGSRARKF
jgi:hypothetical protein